MPGIEERFRREVAMAMQRSAKWERDTWAIYWTEHPEQYQWPVRSKR